MLVKYRAFRAIISRDGYEIPAVGLGTRSDYGANEDVYYELVTRTTDEDNTPTDLLAAMNGASSEGCIEWLEKALNVGAEVAGVTYSAAELTAIVQPMFDATMAEMEAEEAKRLAIARAKP